MEKAKIIVRTLLPYQVWDKAQRRLLLQQVRSTQHMRTKLAELKYRIGDDFLAYRVKFTGQIEDIEKAVVDQLLDKETIPILVASIEGQKAADHPLNHVCTRIMIRSTTQHTSLTCLRACMTLEIALGMLQERITELQNTSEETSFKGNSRSRSTRGYGLRS
mmetsp:Transcript_26555/g.41608  ORF Transcript_26555/g.41608 Transcript_26555/m.41608 type:complete len:162 (+) Transcript_26555:284-769(+)